MTKASNYLFFIVFLLMHDHTLSMQNLSPRYDRMLTGKQRSPPPPSSSRLYHPKLRTPINPSPPPPPQAPPVQKPFPMPRSVDPRPPPPPPPAYIY